MRNRYEGAEHEEKNIRLFTANRKIFDVARCGAACCGIVAGRRVGAVEFGMVRPVFVVDFNSADHGSKR